MVSAELCLCRVGVRVSGFVGYLYTAKLAKTILITVLGKLEEHFKPSRGPEPKLVHVTPLYVDEPGGKKKCIYSYALCGQRNGIVKCEGPPKPIALDGDYYFYFGFHTKVVEPSELVSALLSSGSRCLDYMSQKVCFEVNTVDVFNARALSSDLVRGVLEAGGLKLQFSSPTMLRDPLRPTGKYKTYLPTPFNVFATPVYTILYTKGQYTVRKLRSELLKLHRLFSESYSVLGGVRVRWVYYGRRPEPALVGFVNYRLNHEYLDYLKQRGVDVESWLGEILAYTLALGVGAGRAAGFGHVDIKPLGLKQAPEQPGG